MTELLAQAGDIPPALDRLEKACADRDFMIMYVRVAPNLDPIRNEPRSGPSSSEAVRCDRVAARH